MSFNHPRIDDANDTAPASATDARPVAGTTAVCPAEPCKRNTFAPNRRRAIQRLFETSIRYADLSETFPALLFKISKLPDTSHSYRRLTAMVEEGQPLRRIATAAGIPFWMRHLPPQAFEDESAFALPVSPRFSKRIVNHLPAREEESRA